MNFGMNDVFKILNFIVFCIGAAYLMFRYGILYIMSAIRLDKQQKDEEDKKHATLVHECSSIKELSQKEELAYISMQKRFELWNIKEQKDQELKEQWFYRYQQELAKKRVLKIQNMQQQQIIQLQLPNILQEVYEQMQEKFKKDSALQKKYTDTLIAFMREKTV